VVDLAVVIVTWNVRDLALEALRSLYADLDSSRLSGQVWVVDSASSDGTVEAIRSVFPQVRLIASAENLGFARANNLALRELGFGQAASTDLPPAVYLLNPDTITQPGATRTLYDTLMSNPDAGLVGAQLAYGDGSFQAGAFGFPGMRQLWVEFFPTPGRLIEGRFNGRYPRALYDSGVPFAVDCVLGATMMLRREVIHQTGMFDEQFFMYCEEIDWAWRIHRAGWQVLCAPAARVTHLAGQSAGQARPRAVVDLWTSRLRLFDKHYPAWKRTAARRLIVAGMARKIAQGGDAAVLDAYRRIQQMASEGS
jgi:GT2 family glycosyltransferase